MFKTFEDFIKLAARTYGLTTVEAKDKLVDRLKFYGISVRAVECYINWADNDCMTTVVIGESFGITQQAVYKHLSKIKEVWPHLFNFGPSPNHRCNVKQLPDDFENFLQPLEKF